MKTSIKSAAAVVGATGIEPVTPTMSTNVPLANLLKFGEKSRKCADLSRRCSMGVHGHRFDRTKGNYVT